MNVLYYRWGPSNLLWGICYTSVKGGNINFDECVVLQVGVRLTYCEVSVILQLRGITLTLMNVLYYRWGRLAYCEVSVNLLEVVKGGNINFDECVVLQVGAV